MKNKLLAETLVSLALIILMVSFLDPWQLWMPSQLAMMFLLFLIILYVIFAIFVWREKSQDERETLHKLMASRTAWLVGSLVLIVGLVVQALRHEIDPWILYALLAMVLAKSLSRLHKSIKN